jgi:transcriptional antiterminator RfaH
MMVLAIHPESAWYVVHTHPRQEERVNRNLMVGLIETFSPKVKQRRYSTFTGLPNYISKPLFPGYLFARVECDSMLHKIRFTRGVHSVISFGHEPALVEDRVIANIRSQVMTDGFVRINESLKQGDEVIIKGGPFTNLKGIFERSTKDTDRIVILISAITYQGRIFIDSPLVEKLDLSLS